MVSISSEDITGVQTPVITGIKVQGQARFVNVKAAIRNKSEGG